jgi:Mn-dependent DtxR family transcriptional regulator
VLAQENANLKASVKQLYHRVSELEQENVNTKVVLLKEMTNEEATKEIQRLFATGKTYYYSDIAEELGLPLKTVVDICRDLENNGEIGVDEQIPSGTC